MSNRPDVSAEFRSLFENAPLPYQSLDEEARLLQVNQTWCELLGYSEDEVLGRPVADFLEASSRRSLPERFRAFLSRGYVQSAVFDFLHADGSVVPIVVEGRIGTHSDGSFRQTHCLLRDMRPERLAHQALILSERKYRRLVELAQEGIWQADRKGVTLFVNPAMGRMLGYREEEMVGRHYTDFLDGRARGVAREYLRRRRDGETGPVDIELLAKDGSRVLATAQITILRNERGEEDGALVGIMDVTERRRFQEEMQHTQKLESLGVLAGGIAHDFNNLLQTILGNVDMARLDQGDGLDVVASLDEIETASRRATDLCRQLLAYAGKSSLTPEEINLVDLIAELSEILRASMSKKADLRLEVAPALPHIEADPVQMRQVIVNLMTNASEALEGAPGTITLGLDTLDTDLGRMLRLRVTDTGVGMTEEVRARLFEPFFTTKFTGRGLGLAAVRGIVQAHRGEIGVASVPGEGTMVTVTLPLPTRASADPATAPPTRLAAAPATGRRTVLLADDEPSVLSLGRRMLERLGYEVCEAVDGQEAVIQFQQHRHELALVVLDLTMPNLDGREAFARIRELDQDVPVLVSSGYSEEAVEEGFGSRQPDAILQKPFRLEELQEVLGRLMGMRRS